MTDKKKFVPPGETILTLRVYRCPGDLLRATEEVEPSLDCGSAARMILLLEDWLAHMKSRIVIPDSSVVKP